MRIWDQVIHFFQNWFVNLTSEQRNIFVIASTALFSIALTISVIASMNFSVKDDNSKMEQTKVFSRISPDEIFIPDEPDYLPGVLLERNRRSVWTEEDASVFWQDPLVNGEEPWREKIEAVIDEFLERIP